MSRGLVQPLFPNPPTDYDPVFMAEVVRAFSVFLQQVNNPGPWRATEMTLTNLQTNDAGLEVGALFQKDGFLTNLILLEDLVRLIIFSANSIPILS